jgi:hypothetical protein
MSIQDEAAKIDIVVGPQRALDNTFWRLRENARAQWEKHFAAADPSDACVTVRISTAIDTKSSATPCVGFLHSRGESDTGEIRPRLA